MGQLLTQHLFAEPFQPERDTTVLNAILSDLYRLAGGQISSDNIAEGGIDTENLAPGAVDDAALSDDQPDAPTSISIVGSLDAATNIRQADVTWSQAGDVETEAWEVRWREQGETTYLYEQTGVQSLRIKNLKPATTYEIGVDSISRTGVRAGYAVADEEHLTGAGDQPPEVSLKVDKITTGTMAAEVLISGNIRTADSGQRVMMDSTGVALYDSAGNIVFRLNASTGAASWDTSGAASGTRVMIDQTGLKLYGTVPGTIGTVPANTFPVGGVGTCDNNTSLLMVKPTGVTSGHVLLASVANVAGTDRTITPPSGWTLIERTGDSSFAQAVYYKVAGGSEPASYTWTFNTNTDARGLIAAYSGVDNSDPIDDSSSAYLLSSTTITPASLDPTVPNGMLVALYAASVGTASARLLGSDAMVPANASAASASVLVSTWAGRELIPDTSSTPSRTGTSGVAAGPIVGHHILLKPQQTFVNNTELSASSGQATFKGFVSGSMLSGSQFRTATSGERIEIAPLYGDDPNGGTSIKLYSGTAWPSIFSPSAVIHPQLLNAGTSNEQVGLRLFSGGVTTSAGTSETNTSAIQLLSGQRDENLQGAYIGLLGRNIQIGGSVLSSAWADYGSAAGVVLWEPIQGGTEPSSSPSTNQILTWQPTGGGGGGFRGRNSHGDVWPWGPVRGFADTGSDSGVGSVFPTFETMSTDCAVSFTTYVDNAIVTLTGFLTFVNGGAGWGSGVAVLADGAGTTIGSVVACPEAATGTTIPISASFAAGTAGAKTYRIRVGKTVGAGTVTVTGAQLSALVIG